MGDPDNQTSIPQHIAIIMDGNGRWAKERSLPRAAGHKAGVKALRKLVEHCISSKLPTLTAFAFSSENWRRPEREVTLLMELFMTALDEQVKDLHKHEVQLRFIGERETFPGQLRSTMDAAEILTAGNRGLTLNIAANYGGRWDITRACRQLAEQVKTAAIMLSDIDEDLFGRSLCLSNQPEPDLFIRTGGESRISNYLLWQLAYTELYFTEVLWPDFDAEEYDRAVNWYAERQRRFGRTSEQVESA
ncbi:MAG: Ditrans,polycis-undecaprenyl-diphosphate synthase ((2E,6E)-farnesyl-diphosphate specific) [Gammaproteobacteria bacterium]|nr:Ditrans,polycis-undecaprenyl-diphosphate synthase ((2E,6E)-farnesyl-diphosphate specific) [Gammaproteobacteria bacterium]